MISHNFSHARFFVDWPGTAETRCELRNDKQTNTSGPDISETSLLLLSNKWIHFGLRVLGGIV